MGKLGAAVKWTWNALSGWKTFIVAALLIAQTIWPEMPAFHWFGVLLDGVGWSKVVPAVDPDEAAKQILGAVALGHKLVKAYRQLKAGVPVVELHP
jgi:hypothetical protein